MSTASNWKDMRIRKSEFVTKTQYLPHKSACKIKELNNGIV